MFSMFVVTSLIHVTLLHCGVCNGLILSLAKKHIPKNKVMIWGVLKLEQLYGE
jgi:hypothetical protein